MNKESAEQLNKILLRVVDLLDQSASLVKDQDTKENWDVYRKAVGRAMGEVCIELANPLHNRFPELKPEQLGGSYKVDPKIYQPRFYEPKE